MKNTALERTCSTGGIYLEPTKPLAGEGWTDKFLQCYAAE